jgi:hypothetical protein
MIIFFSLLVSVVGLLIYVLATQPKVVEIGRMMFWTGLLVFMFHSAGAVAVIGK